MLSQTDLSANSPRLRIPIIKMKVVRGGYSYCDNPVITDSGLAFRFMRPYFKGHDREEMVALMLNAKHRMLGLHTISIGSAQFAIVHPRETFKAAIVMNAACLILAHNLCGATHKLCYVTSRVMWSSCRLTRLLLPMAAGSTVYSCT